MDFAYVGSNWSSTRVSKALNDDNDEVVTDQCMIVFGYVNSSPSYQRNEVCVRRNWSMHNSVWLFKE